MIHNMVGGGGEKLFAVIAVTYPAGSICTCGGKEAKDTSGYALFNVKAGTYTVECHTGDNSQSKSTSVTVAESDIGKAIAVTLNYYLAVLENGVLSPLTGGIDGLNSNTKFINGKIVCATVDGPAGHYFTTKNKINMTPYSTLYCRVKFIRKDVYKWRFGLTTTKLSDGAMEEDLKKFTCYHDIDDSAITSGTIKEINLDISKISAESYIALCGMDELEIDKIILYP